MTGRIAVLVSGSGSNMESLADACARGDVAGEIVAVIADRPCAGIDKAKARGFVTAVLEPRLFSDRDEWSAALRERVDRYDPDLVVSAGFMRILAPVFVKGFMGRLINLHPSLLPDFPGAHAVRDALAAGVVQTGTTVHFVDEEVDHGPIILQEKVAIEEGDNEDSLHERIKAVEHRLIPEVCAALLQGRVRLEGGAAVWEPGPH